MNKKIMLLNVFAFLMLLPALLLLWATIISITLYLGADSSALKVLLLMSAIPSLIIFLIFWNFETEGRLAPSFKVLKYAHVLLWMTGSAAIVYLLG